MKTRIGTAVMTALWAAALGYTTVVNATLLSNMTPLFAVGLGWLILSFETYDFFDVRKDYQTMNYQFMERIAQMSLSAVLALYAGVVLGVGFWLKSGTLRWSALALFALTLLNVVLFDMA